VACDCSPENMRIYYATPHLFTEPGPGGAGMQLGEVQVKVCRQCGEASFDLGDHFKSGQRLSVQNRPTEVAVQD